MFVILVCLFIQRKRKNRTKKVKKKRENEIWYRAIESGTPSTSKANYYSKTCVKRPLKIDKTSTLMTNGSQMKVESIAEFRDTFDLH